MRYEPAGPDPTATGCQTGTRALQHAIHAVYPELVASGSVYGCFNRRPIEGSTTWSLHAEGRAVDVGVASQEIQTGWTLACDLVTNRVVYGTMRIIWQHHIWSLERGADWQKLQPGTNQHTDHIHIEQFWSSALKPASVETEYAAQLALAR